MIKNLIHIIFLFLVSTLSTQGQSASCHNVDFHLEVKRMVDPATQVLDVDTLNKYFQEYILIDSRTAKEYNISRLSGAKHMHYRASSKEIDQLPKDKKILVYCSIGKRSDILAKKLNDRGFEAYNLYGGIFEWVNRELPIVEWSSKTKQEITSSTLHQYNSNFGQWVFNKKIQTKGFILYD